MFSIAGSVNREGNSILAQFMPHRRNFNICCQSIGNILIVIPASILEFRVRGVDLCTIVKLNPLHDITDLRLEQNLQCRLVISVGIGGSALPVHRTRNRHGTLSGIGILNRHHRLLHKGRHDVSIPVNAIDRKVACGSPIFLVAGHAQKLVAGLRFNHNAQARRL